MSRITVAASLSILLTVACTHAGPVDGSRAKKFRMQAAGTESATAEDIVTFQGGRRAFVAVQGDHDPAVPLELSVYDANNQLVASDQNASDFLAVFWVPPRTAAYRIVLRNLADKQYEGYPEQHRYTKVYVVIR